MSSRDSKPLVSYFDSFLDFILPKIHLTPTRFDLLLWAFIIWACLLNESEIDLLFASASLKYFPTMKLELSSSFTSPIFLKFVFATALSGVSHLSLRAFARSNFGYLKDAEPADVNQLLELLETKAGLKKIFQTSIGNPAFKQPYSSEVLRGLAATKKIRLLSIAGHEFIGRGEAFSLFYDFLKENHWMKAEIIVLDPDDQETIKERIEQLKKTNGSYTAENIKEQILSTTEKCKKLNSIRGGDNSIELYYCKFHPVFRLIILDETLYMSTYETDCHGHESPVYKFDKSNCERLSLYNSYSNLFEKIKKHSKKIPLI